jgi:hypothetical protein
VKDPKWRGPAGARLRFEIAAREDSWIAVKCVSNEWGAFNSGPKIEYAAAKALKVREGWAEVEVDLADLRPLGSASGKLADWDTLTEISITPNLPAEIKTDEMISSKGGSRGLEPRIRNLRWEGGVYSTNQKAPSPLSEAERTKAFNDSIKASLEQEKRERNGK